MRTALAAGIGERLQSLSLGQRFYVLVFPGLSIPTSTVFSDPDLRRDSQPVTLGDARVGRGRNDFEPVVRRAWPEMNRAFERLSDWGRPRLTGTGSGIFLPMPGAREAGRAAAEIKSLYNCRAAAGVDRSLLHENLYTGGA